MPTCGVDAQPVDYRKATHSYDDESDYDDVQPICDICDHPQWREGEWNGETGNHVECEANVAE